MLILGQGLPGVMPPVLRVLPSQPHRAQALWKKNQLSGCLSKVLVPRWKCSLFFAWPRVDVRGSTGRLARRFSRCSSPRGFSPDAFSCSSFSPFFLPVCPQGRPPESPYVQIPAVGCVFHLCGHRFRVFLSSFCRKFPPLFVWLTVYTPHDLRTC